MRAVLLGEVMSLERRYTRIVKRVTLQCLERFKVPELVSHLTRDTATILILHRFRCPDNPDNGDAPEVLRALLRYLRKHRYKLISVEDLLERATIGQSSLSRTVAFTIDDGYFDQASVAAPILCEYDCPVTVFVTTGFLDGILWMWWDQVRYILEETPLSSIRLAFGGQQFRLPSRSDKSVRSAYDHFVGHCKTLPSAQRQALVRCLAEAAQVDVPQRPPVRYSPMSWKQLREWESRGIRFGPHTVTHPILSRVSPDVSEREIVDSWTRLCQEARRPVPIMCFPNGTSADFGDRELQTVRRLGFLGAVTANHGFAKGFDLRRCENARFDLPRLGLPETLLDCIQYVSGVEHAKSLCRAWFSRSRLGA